MYFIDYSTLSVLIYFGLLIAIGLYAMKTSTSNNSDYLLGGRQVSAKVTALSAGASDMSGWMLLGLPGAAFISGLDSLWLAVGLVIGAYVNYTLVAPRLRVYTEIAKDALTIPEFLAKRFDLTNSPIRVVSALVIIFFFTIYTASGLVAGGKLFESAFNFNYELGVFITLAVVVAYTALGGFLAVSLSDFIQGIIMLIALVAVPVTSYLQLPATSVELVVSSFSFSSISTDFIVALSLLTWGLGYFGQPHIIVRFMAINSHNSIGKARKIGISWMSISILGAVMTGIIGAELIKNKSLLVSDPETIFIFLSQYLFHPIVAGWLLAAILAAIMSTISSQLLVTSSSLVEDIYKVYLKKNISDKAILLASRVCVMVVAIVAFVIATAANNNVLSLVSSAWAGFGAAFGPVILLSLWWKKLTQLGALAGIITGASTVVIWAYVPILPSGNTLSFYFYELLPGFIASGLAAVVVSSTTKSPSEQSIIWFERTKKLCQQ